ncbi:MAG: hypothetical protein QM784_09910 [Polyangiaceae bacterium]
MKKAIALLGLVCATFTAPAMAATGSVVGPVNAVYVPISSTAATQITLTSATSGSVGACKMPPAAARIFMLPAGTQGDKMRSLIMAAELAGKNVYISWDDTKVDTTSGYCIVQSVGLLN